MEKGNKFYKRIQSLIFTGEYAAKNDSYLITVTFLGQRLVDHQALDKAQNSYPFSYYPSEKSPEPAARGLLTYKNSAGISGLWVSLFEPVRQEALIYSGSEPEPQWNEEPQKIDKLIVSPAHLRYQDLFPYLYLRPWPAVTAADLYKRFISFSGEKDEFYSTLAQFKLDRNAMAMKQEAVAFINGYSADGKPKYIGQFVVHSAELKSILKQCCLLGNWLYHQNTVSFNDLTVKVEELIGSWDTVKKEMEKPQFEVEDQRVWSSLWALILILGYRYEHLEDLLFIIMGASVLKKTLAALSPDSLLPDQVTSKADLNENQITQWSHGTIILTADIFPVPPADVDNPVFNRKTILNSEWILPYAIGELTVVQYYLKHYQLGEVSHVENILKGEFKELTQRYFDQDRMKNEAADADVALDSGESARISQDFLQEVNKTLFQRLTAKTYNNGADGDGSQITGGWVIANNPAGGDREDAAKFAKDVVNKTVKRMEQAVNRMRLDSRVKEAERTVTHRFDNTQGNQNIMGLYRWVNKVYRLKTIKKSNILVLEMAIDKPGDLVLKYASDYCPAPLLKPNSPEKLGVFSYENISEQVPNTQCKPEDKSAAQQIYYLDLLEQYKIKEFISPPGFVIVSDVIQGIKPMGVSECRIPKGYIARELTVSMIFNNPLSKADIVVGNEKKEYVPTQIDQLIFELSGNHEIISVSIMVKTAEQIQKEYSLDNKNGIIRTDYSQAVLPVREAANESVEVKSTDNYYIATISVLCEPSTEWVNEWKHQIYILALNGYERCLELYYADMEKQQKFLAAQNQEILYKQEKQQIKSKCLQLIRTLYYQLTRPFVEFQGEFQATELTEFQIDEPRYNQFFEQAIVWEEMSYTLEPDDGFSDNENPTYTLGEFSRFLNAQKARILLPVAKEFQQKLLFFLATGTLWPGKDRLCPVLNAILSMVNETKYLQEMPQTEKRQETNWEICVPTSMEVLTNNSQFPEFGEKS
jgi:hypothetical protein